MRNACFESMGRRALARLTPAELDASPRSRPLAQYVESVPETGAGATRPTKALPVSVVGFGRRTGHQRDLSSRLGGSGRGFVPYIWEPSRLVFSRCRKHVRGSLGML